ncbi:MAG: hypothetical protein MMC23_004012 [Stictis urceolatum]|nr:hypothetical protein [Stictis urceolata]
MSASSAKQPLYKLPHATKLQFLHIYRRLLRETTYLPDPWAREYWRNYITSRFDAYHPRQNDDSKPKDPLAKEPGRPIHSSQRATILLRSSRNFLRTLCRANEGFPSALTVVLRHAYGRTGVRKYQLLQPYLAHDPPADSASLQDLMTQKVKAENEQGPSVPEGLRVIAVAQKSHNTNIPSTPIRRVDALVPEKNAWGRPMPLCRVRNMRRKHLSELIELVMPPLSRSEWERLRDLALGQHPWGGFKPRRAGSGQNVWHRTRYLSRPRGSSGPRQMTARSMRREWERLFLQCSLIEKDAKGKWTIQWGRLARSGVPELAADESDGIFEGVDANLKGRGYRSEYNRLKLKEARGEK